MISAVLQALDPRIRSVSAATARSAGDLIYMRRSAQSVNRAYAAHHTIYCSLYKRGGGSLLQRPADRLRLHRDFFFSFSQMSRD